ncbi:MAG: ACP S-malonyltransferase [Saprospiraceae bacterium]|nr:ACP S-malonyltransferase [Bacteroidia bacterium]NNE14473.1 ACP S-malonyltransferase [Saprospiraceae bacterium]NNL92750.1 ACP S-malonyltransferase [Saprospiraceae bacterium]
MAVLLFPGQGSQHVGMGKDLFESNDEAKALFLKADEILGFSLSDTMFNGTEEDLKKTRVTQPAVFLNSYVHYAINKSNVEASAVAGHSLGEFTALTANGVLDFRDGLNLVYQRALAMQAACNDSNGTMAAILGLEDEVVEKLCEETSGVIVAANYNCPGQLVVSGEVEAINTMVEKAKEAGARRALVLNVDGAFHSPLMQSAQEKLKLAISNTAFNVPTIPIYQNVSGKAETDAEVIKANLIKQLTDSVRWTQSMQNMIKDGHNEYIEFGAKVLSGFLRRVDRSLNVSQL